eukprot:CAMPEP_0115016528 /NCGR_PEP_ID=MMETSP0216-20121206/27500_1 /TAXON_ID=223996 /ORGANISM="Protocruzia adherens, Strain Boccale" /LENGTH=321 /DNA_ID=CAMNT_0002387021 /DNA_START=41 /DNA_END=1003 /DNA_ORIENTATION=-
MLQADSDCKKSTKDIAAGTKNEYLDYETPINNSTGASQTRFHVPAASDLTFEGLRELLLRISEALEVTEETQGNLVKMVNREFASRPTFEDIYQDVTSEMNLDSVSGSGKKTKAKQKKDSARKKPEPRVKLSDSGSGKKTKAKQKKDSARKKPEPKVKLSEDEDCNANLKPRYFDDVTIYQEGKQYIDANHLHGYIKQIDLKCKDEVAQLREEMANLRLEYQLYREEISAKVEASRTKTYQASQYAQNLVDKQQGLVLQDVRRRKMQRLFLCWKRRWAMRKYHLKKMVSNFRKNRKESLRRAFRIFRNPASFRREIEMAKA